MRDGGRALRGGPRKVLAPAKSGSRHPVLPLGTIRFHFTLRALSSLFAAAFALTPLVAQGDCSLKTTGHIPLPDLGAGTYQGFTGGLYPNGANTRPAQHEAAGLAAANQVKPLDAAGNLDTSRGTIALVSIGLSNTTAEFGNGGDTAFKPRADADPSKGARVTIVDGAQGGKDAADWANPDDEAWTILAQRLSAAGVT